MGRLCSHFVSGCTVPSETLIRRKTFDIIPLDEHHVQHGGTRLVLDEVHYVKDWQKIVKNLYDDFRDLKIAYTGSSLLRLKARQGDLSWRQVGYELPGLSFREFLKFEGVMDWNPVSSEDVLSRHLDIAREITKKVRILQDFQEGCGARVTAELFSDSACTVAEGPCWNGAERTL